MRRTLLAAGLALAALAPAAALEQGYAPLAVTATPMPEFMPGSGETRFGDLEYLGGLRLQAGSGFGGLSGLDILPDGETLVAISDTGNWFTARIAMDDDRLTGLTETGLAPLLLDNGEPPPNKFAGDAEGLRIVTRHGALTAYVSFEQYPAIRTYAGPDLPAAEPGRVPLPTFVDNLPSNQGLEGIAIAPLDGPLAGAILLTAERALDAHGNHRAFVLDGPRAGAFAIARSDDFDITDAAFLPSGDLIILERRFSYVTGAAMRLRRIAGAEIVPGATVTGRVLMTADGRYRIDNMEGLAISTADDGRTLITLVSDDNTSFFQQTVLLRFALVE